MQSASPANEKEEDTWENLEAAEGKPHPKSPYLKESDIAASVRLAIRQ